MTAKEKAKIDATKILKEAITKMKEKIELNASIGLGIDRSEEYRNMLRQRRRQLRNK